MTKEQAIFVLSCAIRNLLPENQAILRYHARIKTILSDGTCRHARFSAMSASMDLGHVTSEAFLAANHMLFEGVEKMATQNVHGVGPDFHSLYLSAFYKLSDDEVMGVVN